MLCIWHLPRWCHPLTQLFRFLRVYTRNAGSNFRRGFTTELSHHCIHDRVIGNSSCFSFPFHRTRRWISRRLVCREFTGILQDFHTNHSGRVLNFAWMHVSDKLKRKRRTGWDREASYRFQTYGEEKSKKLPSMQRWPSCACTHRQWAPDRAAAASVSKWSLVLQAESRPAASLQRILPTGLLDSHKF